MVTTTMNSGIYGNEEANKIMLEIAGYKTPLKVVKDYFGLRDEELKNSKRLKELGVKWFERLGEVGCSKEQFNILFGDVLEDENKQGNTSNSNNTSIVGVEGEGSLQATKGRTKKGA